MPSWDPELFEGAPDGVLVVDGGTGAVRLANRAAHEMMRYAPGELVGKRIGDLTADPVEPGGVRDVTCRCGDGSTGVLECCSRRLDDGRIVCMMRDVGDRREARRALRESESRLRAMFDSTIQAVMLLDLEGRLQTFNRVAEEWMRQLIGRSFETGEVLADLVQMPDAAPFSPGFQGALQGRTETQMVEVPTSSGGVEWFEVSYTPLRDGDGRMTGVVLHGQRVTEQKQAEEALRESERRLALALEGAELGMWDWRLDDNTMVFNDQFAHVFGYDSADELGRDLDWLRARVHPEDYERARAAFQAHLDGRASRYEVELRMQTRDGSYKWILSRGKVSERDAEGQPVRVTGTNLDLDRRKRLEAELRQAQRLEALGRLAGGVAHDFNNLLTIIIANAGLLEGSPERRSTSIRHIREAADRAAEITRQLLAFGRRQVLETHVIDPREVMSGMLSLLQRLLPEHIEVELQETAPTPWPIEVDPVQLEQAILNLSLNARDAMPDGGRLTITMRNETVERPVGREHQIPPGEYVTIEVRDTGHGFDPSVSRRIFEPFFTTKELGQGAGLGLATVYGAVSQQGGTVTCQSEPGKGSAFRIYLPRAHGSVERPAPRPSVQSVAGSETVLVVEDEAAVRRVACEVLRRQGYRTLSAECAEEALALVDQHASDLALLLTDVVMPDTSGPDLAEAVRRRAPDVKVLYMSGYSDEVLSGVEGEVEFIPKPFTLQTLSKRVREVLDGG